MAAIFQVATQLPTKLWNAIYDIATFIAVNEQQRDIFTVA